MFPHLLNAQTTPIPCTEAMVGAGGGSSTSPTGVVASSTHASYALADLINEDGLTGINHGNAFNTMWMCTAIDAAPTLTFDLGASHTVYGANIWQYNYNAAGTTLNRGAQCITISYSTDDIAYTLIGSALLTEADGSAAIAAQTKNFPSSVTARYILFELISNLGNPDGYTGLSEVKFSYD